MKALLIPVIALLLVGCEERYRYPCQDPENAEKAECNRPACEADGMCYDSLNGLLQKQTEIEEVPAVPAADLNNTGE